MLKLIKRKHNLSIRDFYNRRNKVLIRRTLGGFGDILMQRMMFEDFSKIDVEIHYACPHEFMEMSLNHPFLKNIKEINKVSLIDYGIIYDITTICAITESKELSNNKRHRSDIWANHCGVELTKHEMHLYPEIEQIENCKRLIKEINPNGHEIIEGVTFDDMISRIEKLFDILCIKEYHVMTEDKLKEYNDYVDTTVKVK